VVPAMTKRGRIIRISGVGAVSVDGFEYKVAMDRVWRSPTPPMLGMEVEVTFHPEIGIAAISSVANRPSAPAALLSLAPPPSPPPFQLLMRSQGGIPTSSTGVPWQAWKAAIGLPALIAMVVITLAWLALPSLTLGFPGLAVHPTFWELFGNLGNLGLLSGAGGGTGNFLLSLLVIAALLGPVLPCFWKNRLAPLAGCLAALVMAVGALSVYRAIHHLSEASSAWGGALAAQFVEGMSSQLLHWEPGFFIGAIAAAYLAYDGIAKMLAIQRSQEGHW